MNKITSSAIINLMKVSKHLTAQQRLSLFDALRKENGIIVADRIEKINNQIICKSASEDDWADVTEESDIEGLSIVLSDPKQVPEFFKGIIERKPELGVNVNALLDVMMVVMSQVSAGQRGMSQDYVVRMLKRRLGATPESEKKTRVLPDSDTKIKPTLVEDPTKVEIPLSLETKKERP